MTSRVGVSSDCEFISIVHIVCRMPTELQIKGGPVRLITSADPKQMRQKHAAEGESS